MVPLPSQSAVVVCNLILLLSLHYTSYRLVTLLKIMDAPVKVAVDVLDLTVSFKFINFSFQIFLLFVPEMSSGSVLTLFRLNTLLWLESCNHCILAYFLSSKNPKHFSSNQGFCCLNSYRP